MELLSFYPIFKAKVWGGQKIRTKLGKDFSPLDLENCGETWEISDDSHNMSIVSSGQFKDISLRNLILKYKEQLLGHQNYANFGPKFPLLIKFIDAHQDLSIQVHPDDSLASKKHNCFGKTEFWYILDHSPNAQILYGFKTQTDQDTYLNHLKNNTLSDLLRAPKVRKGDTFFIPAGRIHAIGSGILLTEIQQASDITYRIYDYNRPDKTGQLRTLHTEDALDAIDFQDNRDYRQNTQNIRSKNLCSNAYFSVNYHLIDKIKQINYINFDAFVIYICVEGAGYINYQHQNLDFKLGQVILLPATIDKIELQASKTMKILECYIPQ